ncbi:MAG: nucleoside triphosphate pyrophosphohydrolase [Pseudomonadota bacterium]
MTAPIDRLRAIMATLRNPDGGCAWDLVQTFETIAPFTVEEAYEVADAIERGNLDDICEECGDLLLQVVFLSQIAAEDGHFTFDDVATAICEKLIRRHPHIFADGPARTPEEIKRIWDEIKAEEKAGKPQGLIEDVPVGLPTLQRAQKMQKRLSKAGLDWEDGPSAATKIAEEVAEFQEAALKGDTAAMADEFGDVLFTLVNVARHAGIDADAALRATNAKVAARVRHIEAEARAEGANVETFDLAEWDRRWTAAKAATKDG